MSITVDGEPLVFNYLLTQIDYFFSRGENVKVSIAKKARRVGLTHGGINYMLERCIEGNNILWIDTTYSNIDKYYRKFMEPVLKNIKSQYWKWSKQKRELGLFDGHIDMRSAERGSNLEGDGYDVIIINEAGIVLKGLKGRLLYLESILPMSMDKNADIFLIGTSKGKKSRKDEKVALGCEYSLYFELACRGEKEHDTYSELYRTTKYSSYSNPLLSAEAIKNLEREIPPHLRKQELEGEFSDLDGTGIYHQNWFNIVDVLPPISEWREFVISADTAFKTSENNDPTAYVLMINCNNGYYILDMVNKRLDFVDLVNNINEYYQRNNFKWGKQINKILIEDKASGQSAIQVFNKKTKLPVKAIKVDTDKYTRALATTPIFETGHVFLLRGGWNNELISQMCEFNALMDTPDDIVDSVTQAINYFEKRPNVDFSNIW